MNITFQGIKNITAKKYGDDDEPLRCLSMQLTNDANGNDLDEYKKVLRPHLKTIDLAHPCESDFFHLSYCGDNYEQTTYSWINGEKFDLAKNINYDTEYEITDATLPLFSFISKLTKRISQMKDRQFVYDEEYLNSQKHEAYLFLDKDYLSEKGKYSCIGMPLEKRLNEYYTSWSEPTEDEKIMMVDPQEIRTTAKAINKNFHRMMCEYFDVQA